jgi:hypothetical protein
VIDSDVRLQWNRERYENIGGSENDMAPHGESDMAYNTLSAGLDTQPD